MEKDTSHTQKKVVRFAPSPTGLLHIGSVRTALFNYLYAKRNQARTILRFEDTDTTRSQKEFEDNIVDGLAWLGLQFDETYRQSERTLIYAKHIQFLIASGFAYVSDEVSGDRKSVIRFKNPNTSITFNDEIRGEVTFDTTELQDFVIAKSETEPLYHLAVVIDDYEMGVTHIIRGEDHISNTPRQILILEALGAPRPAYAHIPMILASDRSKMSKRHGTVAITEYRNQGFVPAALINYLALLGWNPGGEKELFSLHELIELFDFSRVHKSGAIFSMEKMKWFNAEHLKLMPLTEKREVLQLQLAHTEDIPPEFTALVLSSDLFVLTLFERIEILSEAAVFAKEGEYDYLFRSPTLTKEALLWKAETALATAQRLEKLTDLLGSIDFKNPESIKESVWEYATEEGRGQVLSPFRVALSGKERSLDPFTIGAIIGKIETLGRLRSALTVLTTYND
ncbi:MAG: glutamate--tRNA ligase [Candidatus Paceibacterota bacterium]